jgi:hypothetical protein
MPEHVISSEDGSLPLAAYSHCLASQGVRLLQPTGPVGSDGNLRGETSRAQMNLSADNIEAILRVDGASLGNVHPGERPEINRFSRFDAASRERFSGTCQARLPFTCRVRGGETPGGREAELTDLRRRSHV